MKNKKESPLPIITKHITFSEKDMYLEIPEFIRNTPESISRPHKEIIRL